MQYLLAEKRCEKLNTRAGIDFCCARHKCTTIRKSARHRAASYERAYVISTRCQNCDSTRVRRRGGGGEGGGGGRGAGKEAFPKIRPDERYMQENTGESRSRNAVRHDDACGDEFIGD